jgi:hypothetical protein
MFHLSQNKNLDSCGQKKFWRHQKGASRCQKLAINLIASVSPSIAADHHNKIQDLAKAHGMSLPSLVASCFSQQGPAKKSTGWVPKLLSQEHMEERVKTLFVFEY